MVWIASAVALGLCLGVLGYYFSKASYSLFTLSMSIFVFGSDYIATSLGIETPAGTVKVPSSEAGNETIFSVGNVFFRAIDNMGMLPEQIKIAIVCFVVAFFLGRIMTWVADKFYPRKPVVEDKAARRKRILTEYGYTNGQLPY